MKLTKLLTRIGLAAVLLSTLNSQLSTAHAQGTQFTYQGLLDSGGVPVDGANDLTFTLYNAATLGATVGTSNVFNDMLVSNGLFTVTLDFGAGAFDGSARWLEIAARPGASTGAYTNLAPRQPVTPTPYAMFAGGASAAGVSGTLSVAQIPILDAATKLTGTVADARLSANVALLNRPVQAFTGGTNSFAGRVGIGTATPSVPLSLGTSLPADKIKLALYDAPGDTYGLGIAGGAMTFHVAGGSSTNEKMRITAAGHVGIGTTTPGRNLSIVTTVAAGSDSTAKLGLHAFGGNEWVAQSVSGFDTNATAAGTPTGSLQLLDTTTSTIAMTLSPAGNVGIGTVSPSEKLSIGTSSFDATATASLSLNANGGHKWIIQSVSGFGGGLLSAPAGSLVLADVTGPGNVYLSGELYCSAVNLTSDRNAKEDFRPVSGREVLAKVAALPITEWQYKTAGDARHIGPMAQDFHAAFGTGRDDKHIASVDADGVALAAIQGLNEKLDEKAAEVEALKQSVAELKELVKQLTQPAGR